jgi:hypothetical protein
MLTDKERGIAKMHYEAIILRTEDPDPHWEAIEEMIRPDNAQELSDLRIIVALERLPELLAQEGVEMKRDYVAIDSEGNVIASSVAKEKKYQS